MTDFLTGDTIDLTDAEFTILTYVDSSGCTECKMKLLQWKEIINVIDSTTDYRVATIIAINSLNRKLVYNQVKRCKYDYPIFLDLHDSLNSLNSFPKELEYNTMLLDKDKRVLAIGNPIYLHSIMLLYESILSGRKVFNRDMTSEIIIDDNVFSIRKSKNIIKKSIKIYNIGRDSICIQDIITSCNCIEAFVSHKIIPPREHIDLELKIKPDSIDDKNQLSINIYYKDFYYPSIIKIQGKASQVMILTEKKLNHNTKL